MVTLNADKIYTESACIDSAHTYSVVVCDSVSAERAVIQQQTF